MYSHCLQPEYNAMMCDVRVADDNSPWLDGTKCILLLGEYAMHKFCPETRGNTLNEMRGSPLMVNGICAIASFFPQDAAEIAYKNHEAHLNTQSKEYIGDEAEKGDDEDEGDVKRAGKTKRSNYAFWLRADTRKCKEIIKQGGKLPPRKYPEPIYHIYPSCDEVVNVLSKHKGGWMDFDIETDYEKQNLLCFSFSFDGINIYGVPVLDNNYQWAYSGLHRIMRSLCIAIRDNTVVAHNGAAFDGLVMGLKYHIPIVKMYDTMLAMQRCFPDIEKSLMHVTSYWTWEPFHKDQNPDAYFTRDDMVAKVRYCCKDVYTMSCVRKEIQRYATTIPGLVDSISCVMASIRPYLTTTIMGIPYDEDERQAKIKENDRLMMQYIRIINLLVGEQGMKDVQSVIKGRHKGAMPSSNVQCVKYFHDLLGYAIVGRGKPSKVDGARKPSLAKKYMYRLRLKYENPVIDFCNAYRYTRLECTTPLGFNPWKDNDNKIIKRPTNQSSQTNTGVGNFIPTSFKA